MASLSSISDVLARFPEGAKPCERKLRRLARQLGCYIASGRGMAFTEEDVTTLIVAIRPCGLAGWETWRDIEGFPAYQIGSYGRVRRISGGKPKQLNGGVHKNGYARVTFYAGGGRVVQKYIHRLVCEAFHGPPPEGRNTVCHKDGDQRNNAADNLYWGTHEENVADAIRHGTHISCRDATP